MAASCDSHNIGIVGAGVSGLFTAMVFDHLNDQLAKAAEKGKQPLRFEYTILEANPEERVGGRLFTYKFDKSKNLHDYVDVGAMRFPDNPIMSRVFNLFNRLDMNKVSFEAGSTPPNGSIIPYYLNNDNGEMAEPWRYNDKTLWTNDIATLYINTPSGDPFHLATDGSIPVEVLRHSPSRVFKAAIKPLADALKEDMEDGGQAGWELLMKYDGLSTREFLRNFPNLGVQFTNPEIPLPPYNANTIEWLETFNGGTNWYDQALSESVLEYLDFSYKKKIKWYCILGGSQELAKRILDKLVTKPLFNSPVKAIRQAGIMQVEVDIGTATKTQQTKTSYGLFTTTSLGCLRRMDISKAGLSYGARDAIRSLGYGQASKVAMRFKRAWWIHDLGNYNIKKGGQGHTDLHIRTCVYPSYNIYDKETDSAVLLVSYTWQQDSQRLSCLMHNRTHHNEGMAQEIELRELLFKELALLHSNPSQSPEELLRIIKDSYLEHFAFDWDNEPTTAGAFAFFRPQQFQHLWSKIIQPSGDVIIVGEAASPHHAWVVGALESAVHGIYSWLSKNKFLVSEFKDAMDIIDRATPGNPFQGLPPYMNSKLAQSQGLLAIAHQIVRQGGQDIIDLARLLEGLRR